VFFPVRVDFLHKLLLIYLRGLGDGLLEMLFQIGVGLDMGSINENNLRRKIPGLGNFFKNPAKNPFDHLIGKAMTERIAHRCKIRQRLSQAVPQESSVGHVHFRILQCLPKETYAEQMLDHVQLEKYHGITAWPTIIFAVQFFYEFVDTIEIQCLIDFPQRMILGHQHIRTQHLNGLPLLRFLL